MNLKLYFTKRERSSKETLKVQPVKYKFEGIFVQSPLMCFHRNKHLEDFLCRKTIVSNKACKVNSANKKGYLKLCYSKPGNLCFKQVSHIHFKYRHQKSNIFNIPNCKSNYLIYLMECTLC